MQQGDVGAPIRFHLVDGTAVFPLQIGSAVELWIRKPSGALLLRSFEIVDHAAASVYYETVAGDLSEHGLYRFQARVLAPDGDRVAFGPVDEPVAPNVFPAALLTGEFVLPSPAALALFAPDVAAMQGSALAPDLSIAGLFAPDVALS